MTAPGEDKMEVPMDRNGAVEQRRLLIHQLPVTIDQITLIDYIRTGTELAPSKIFIYPAFLINSGATQTWALVEFKSMEEACSVSDFLKSRNPVEFDCDLLTQWPKNVELPKGLRAELYCQDNVSTACDMMDRMTAMPDDDGASLTMVNPETMLCVGCGVRPPKLKCSRCLDPFCALECHRQHWPRHKAVCFPPPALIPFEESDSVVGGQAEPKQDLPDSTKLVTSGAKSVSTNNTVKLGTPAGAAATPAPGTFTLNPSTPPPTPPNLPQIAATKIEPKSMLQPTAGGESESQTTLKRVLFGAGDPTPPRFGMGAFYQVPGATPKLLSPRSSPLPDKEADFLSDYKVESLRSEASSLQCSDLTGGQPASCTERKILPSSFSHGGAMPPSGAAKPTSAALSRITALNREAHAAMKVQPCVKPDVVEPPEDKQESYSGSVTEEEPITLNPDPPMWSQDRVPTPAGLECTSVTLSIFQKGEHQGSNNPERATTPLFQAAESQRADVNRQVSEALAVTSGAPVEESQNNPQTVSPVQMAKTEVVEIKPVIQQKISPPSEGDPPLMYGEEHMEALGEPGETLQVLITGWLNDTVAHVSCYRSKHFDTAAKLWESATTYCATAQPILHKPSLTELVLALFEGSYFRAMVTCEVADGATECSVMYLDYGNSSTVSLKDVYPMPKEFMRVPCISNLIRILDVFDKSDQVVPEHVAVMQKMLPTDTAMLIDIQGMDDQGFYTVTVPALSQALDKQ